VRAFATVVGALLAVSLGVPGWAAPPPEPPERSEPASDRGERPCELLAPGQTVLVDLRDAPLSDVARLVSCAVGRNVLFAPTSLGGRQVTVYSVRPVDGRGLRDLWAALLRSNGLVSERHGAYDVIRPERP